ncbi:MAG: tetratricopeptide repeat protein, partial [Acidobacteriia bacterium]|nr:tetratricopeptide repeat protein [Terriglobia bacterium]
MNAGRTALEERRYEEAEKQFKAALEEAEGFGPRDPRLITSLETLAELYQRQGKTAPQEPIKKRILELREGELGST